MARKVTVTMIDDIDGSVAVETVPIGLDGVAYEIDLSSDNAGKLRTTLAEYVQAARKLTGIGSKPRVRRASTGTDSGPGANYSVAQRKEIREWCLQHGARMGERGRLPAWAYEAWEAKDTSKLVTSEVLADV